MSGDGKQVRLDWTTEYSDTEWSTLRAGYDSFIGPGKLDELIGFIPMMHSVRPDTLKRFRLVADIVTQGVGLSAPHSNPPVTSMIAGHYNTVIGYPEGIEGDLFVAKKVGGQRQEVSDILAMAWVHSGMSGMNVASQVCRPLLDTWTASDDGPGLSWPENWMPDDDAFKSGVEFSSYEGKTEADPADVEGIVAWHRKVQGEVPLYVSFFAEHYPLALIGFRARFETSLSGTLPKQFIALCLVHLSAAWRQPAALRRSVYMARLFGVSKEHVVQVLAYSQMVLGDLGMDAALEGITELFAEW